MKNRTVRFALTAALMCVATSAFAELKPGQNAPTFVAPAFLAGDGFAYQLRDELKKGPVVLYFFPAAFTAGCNIEARLFSEAVAEFKSRGVSVIGVTAGNINRLAEFSRSTEGCSGKFPVASDTGAKIAKQYDALLALKPGWSSRTSYLIGQNGRILAVHSAMDPKGHVKAMLDATKRLPVRKQSRP